MMFRGSDSPMESELHNHENFVCIGDDQPDEQALGSEPNRERPRDQGDELVEVDITGANEEPQLVFLSANLTRELKPEILAFHENFEMC